MAFKKSLKLALQIVFSALALWLLGRNLGARNILQALGRVGVSVIAGSILVYLAAQVLSAWRWAIISKIFGFSGEWKKYNSLYFLGMFYNLFLPTGYGGDVVKAIYQAPDRRFPSKTLAALTILLDRFSGFAALLLIGGLASFGLKGVFGGCGAWMAGIFLFLLALGLLLLPIISRLRFLPRKLRFIALVIRKEGMKSVPIAALSIVIQLLNIGIYGWIFMSLGTPLSLAEVSFAYSAVTIFTLLPVSISGLGVRESGWAALLVPFHAPSAAGVSAGLIYFLVQSLSSLPGLYPFFRGKKEA